MEKRVLLKRTFDYHKELQNSIARRENGYPMNIHLNDDNF